MESWALRSERAILRLKMIGAVLRRIGFHKPSFITILLIHYLSRSLRRDHLCEEYCSRNYFSSPQSAKQIVAAREAEVVDGILAEALIEALA
mmetsp:Transcript_29365/g.73741  ORF Transcript_29365/g.73741 Transcript_29365/m.73741 type:complete len:92 (+) Transcript_29365:298-573(+)